MLIGASSSQPAAVGFGELWLKCCFTSTETVGLLGTGAQDGHLDFRTAPELCELCARKGILYRKNVVTLAPTGKIKEKGEEKEKKKREREREFSHYPWQVL